MYAGAIPRADRAFSWGDAMASQLTLFEGTARERTRLEKTPAALGPRETSRLAAVSFDSHSQAGIALAIFRGAGDRGVTIDELAAATGWYPGTASARVDQLRRAGHVQETDRRRETRSKRKAIVFAIRR